MGVRSDGSLRISANADEYKSYPKIESSFKFNVPSTTKQSINSSIQSLECSHTLSKDRR